MHFYPDSHGHPESHIEEVNHCHGRGPGHPCNKGSMRTARKVRVAKAARATAHVLAFTRGISNERGDAKMLTHAVARAVVGVGRLVHHLEHKIGLEDERISHVLHLGETAVEAIVHHFPELLHTAAHLAVHAAHLAAHVAPHIAPFLEADAPHPAVAHLRALQAAYATVALPKGSPELPRLRALQDRIAALLAAAEKP